VVPGDYFQNGHGGLVPSDTQLVALFVRPPTLGSSSSSSSSSKLYYDYCYGQGLTAGVEAAGSFLSSPEGRAMMVEGANAMMAEQSPERRALMEEGTIAMMAGGQSLLANNGK
jgi:hypothetical protein